MNIKDTQEFKPMTIPNPHFLLASEKLFNPPIGNNFCNEFKDGHFISLMDHKDISKMSIKEIVAKTKDYAFRLNQLFEVSFYSKAFIGLGQDSLYLYKLYMDYNITFDTAVLINFDFSVLEKHQSIIKKIKDNTRIYNFYSNNKKYKDSDLAHVSQYIPTRLSPALSKRFALETSGVLVNGSYEMLYMQQDSPSQYRMIDNKMSTVD